MKNDLTHEVSVKHGFSYNGEPCKEVTYTQSPELLWHLQNREIKRATVSLKLKSEFLHFVSSDFNANF